MESFGQYLRWTLMIYGFWIVVAILAAYAPVILGLLIIAGLGYLFMRYGGA